MTHALLLTDVVDSTKLSEQLGDAAMARVWAAHDRVARDLLPVHRGREIDKTDGFLLLFEDVGDAVAYAVAYHHAIGALDPPLKARAGLHVGPVILTENAPADVARGAKPLEVDGLAKPTAARIMSVALGGQTLLSQAALRALGETAFRVVDHGHWHMKGVAEPIPLFEVGDDRAPFTPPPDGAKVYRVVRSGQHWLPVREVKHGLPAERDVFVGRGGDLHALARLVDDGAHLVNVLGIGGTGKTRLVLHYGWAWLGDFPGGAWFCDLSEARDADGVTAAVARALEVPLGQDDAVAQVGHAIGARGRCLVLLDNFEQVARHAPVTLGRWLDRARDAVFVVTSREILGLPGEVALALSPLLPAESFDLFVARALHAKRDFVVDDRPSIEALVKLLDGLPLAIELAAARVRLMPPRTLLARMSERFKLLASAGGRHTRQATLRATFDWSWDLLSADEQQALAQLSVFEGGFTLEAAEAVLALAEAWPIDAVQALVDRSWVRGTGEDRFDMLVSVQEYAAEKLAASGGRPDAEVRHGAFFAALGTDEALDALHRHGGVPRLHALLADLDNVVAATRRAVARGDGVGALHAMQAAAQGLGLRGPASLAVELAQAAYDLVQDAPPLRARAGARLAIALRGAGRLEVARARAEEALAWVRAAGPGRTPELEVRALTALGSVHWEQGALGEAIASWEAALPLSTATGDRVAEGLLCGYLGMVHGHQRPGPVARAWFERGLAIVREVGSSILEAQSLHNLATLERRQGRREAAHAALGAALSIAKEIGNRRVEAAIVSDQASVFESERRFDEAHAHYLAALAMHREVGNRRSEGNVLSNLGLFLANRGRTEEALVIYDQALQVQREVGSRIGETVVLQNLAIQHAELGRTEEARDAFERVLSLHRESGDLSGVAMSHANLGALHRIQGRPDLALGCFEQAMAVAREAQDQPKQANLLRELGTTLVMLDRLDEARGLLETAAALFRDLRTPHDEGLTLAELGALEARMDRPDRERAHTNRAIELLRTANDPEQLARLLAIRARLRAGAGDVDAARADLAEAETLGFGDPVSPARAATRAGS